MHYLFTVFNTPFITPSNDCYGGPTELVQHFRTWDLSKGAFRHIVDMVWPYRSPIPVGRGGGLFYLLQLFIPAFAALT
jgi:hypothetical protein